MQKGGFKFMNPPFSRLISKFILIQPLFIYKNNLILNKVSVNKIHTKVENIHVIYWD